MASKNRPQPCVPETALLDLSSAMAGCDDPKLMQDFLRSLLTGKELQDITLRWELVNQIDKGESQRKISQNLGVSLCKITRGSKELKKPGSPFRSMIDLLRKSNET